MSNQYKISPDWENTLKSIAVRAGEIIMNYRDKDLAVERKADNSQVTMADKAADDYICAELRKLTPEIMIVSEEGTQHAGAETFWCVDPLDGTKGYIKGGDEFTVNIALVHNRLPVLGVIYIPVLAELYYAEVGRIAYSVKNGAQTKLCVRKPPPEGNTLILSHYHSSERRDELAAQFAAIEFLIASSSLKFCRIAEGIADIYPRFGNTMEWDTAAGHAILKAAGGRVMLLDEPEYELHYGKQTFLNPHFVAYGS